MEQDDNRVHAAMQACLRLAAIVESSDDAIIGKDITGIITDWNKGAERLYGYSADEVIGKSIILLLPPNRTDEFAEITRRIRNGEAVRRLETVRQRKDGTQFEVSLNISPIRNSEGQIVGTSTIDHDISERKRAEEALREKDRELSESQRLAKVGSWFWDAQNDRVAWSEELYRIFGRDSRLPAPNYKEHSNLYRVESWTRLSRALDETLRDGTSYELDLELVRPDGTTRWIKARGKAIGDATGCIIGLRGTVQDISEHKLAEETIAEFSRKLLEAQEQERRRISRELHDDISQRLALLSVEIQRVREASPVTYGELRRRMDELGKRTSEISAVVQSLSHGLHSSKLEYLGLVSAMKAFSREFAEKHKVEIDFTSEGIPSVVAPEVSLCLFRVMQEGLHNALKHSGVNFFEVKLHGSSTDIQLTVRDSGVGFDPELVKGTQGLGLISMQERVRLVKGTISITSRPQSGTEINVRVPMSAETTTEQTRVAGV